MDEQKTGVINYPIFDLLLSPGEQMRKVNEEYREVESAFLVEEDNRVIEECCDLIQVTFNLIEIISPSGVMEALNKHSKKMNDRGYCVKYHLELMEGKQ